MSSRHYDAIVVGLGATGSATLYHLAKRGLKVCRYFVVPKSLFLPSNSVNTYLQLTAPDYSP
jgi:succinate dehydrogenase/fumarate reductase flavoprotein subunit